MTVRKGASLEASTASPAAGAIVAALARAGTAARPPVPGRGPRRPAGAPARGPPGPPGRALATVRDSGAHPPGPPGQLRVENGVEAQTLRAAEDTAARAGPAILAEAVRA